MKDLIARLENATGPDRKIDGDIAVLLGRHPLTYRRGKPDWQQHCWFGHGPTWECAEYTNSIDAALTLVPEHYSYELVQSAVVPPRLARAQLWDWRRSTTAWKSEGNRPLAICICIAALRARA